MGQTREQLLNRANETIERLRQEVAQGLDLLPADLRAAVDGAPEDYQWDLGRALFALRHEPGLGDYSRGLRRGEVLGLISAGRTFNVLTTPQVQALHEFVRELQPVKP